MTTARITPTQRPPRLARLTRAVALLCSAALGGCQSLGNLPVEIYAAIGSNPDQTISAELHDAFRAQLLPVEQSFRKLYPGTHFQMVLYPETGMVDTLAQRNRAGLAPDLLYVNGDTAMRLLDAGLVSPFPLSPRQRRIFNPDDLRRVQTADGRLAGMPLLVHTQLSCFNRRQMPTPPTTVQELLAAGAAGQPIGLTVTIDYLLWSVGSLGALESLERVIAGRPVTATDRQAIAGWLNWLREAGSQQRVTFYPDPQTAEAELVAGRVAWIPCRSSALTSLGKKMGGDLAVAPLPNGNGHRASPVNRLRVVALGRNSSRRGRERALEFARYLINPLTQRSLTLSSQIVLPANRFVSVPVQSSKSLATLVAAAEQGRQANGLIALIHGDDPRPAALQALVTALVFGEITPAEANTKAIAILQKQR